MWSRRASANASADQGRQVNPRAPPRSRAATMFTAAGVPSRTCPRGEAAGGGAAAGTATSGRVHASAPATRRSRPGGGSLARVLYQGRGPSVGFARACHTPGSSPDELPGAHIMRTLSHVLRVSILATLLAGCAAPRHPAAAAVRATGARACSFARPGRDGRHSRFPPTRLRRLRNAPPPAPPSRSGRARRSSRAGSTTPCPAASSPGTRPTPASTSPGARGPCTPSPRGRSTTPSRGTRCGRGRPTPPTASASSWTRPSSSRTTRSPTSTTPTSPAWRPSSTRARPRAATSRAASCSGTRVWRGTAPTSTSGSCSTARWSSTGARFFGPTRSARCSAATGTATGCPARAESTMGLRPAGRALPQTPGRSLRRWPSVDQRPAPRGSARWAR